VEKENNIPNFKVPEGYFETFEERLFSKIAEEKFPKTTGFKVPDAYFEKLDERVVASVTEVKSGKVINLFPKKYFGYAAAVAACLLIGFTLFTSPANDSSSLDALQLAAIDTYIEDGNLNFDIYDLTSYIEDKDIKDIDFEMHQFSEDNLEDYLIENLDAATLINEQ
tara:strand:- start:436 stop:936 length:501 start_codon:yes stop_codon:yes gene_type:complete